jgi:hypothetical protein
MIVEEGWRYRGKGAKKTTRKKRKRKKETIIRTFKRSR